MELGALLLAWCQPGDEHPRHRPSNIEYIGQNICSLSEYPNCFCLFNHHYMVKWLLMIQFRLVPVGIIIITIVIIVTIIIIIINYGNQPVPVGLLHVHGEHHHV